jgi:phosphate/sulfate permease
METIYLILVIVLFVLAISDLVVGVSNDAVNFLNSAIGSKAFSFKTIMVTASLGIFIGAVFSSGMMEVARKGIFNPGMFAFDDIMVVFLAVMLADIILLDVFNSLGLPTSTTVSIVFDLLGAAVAVGVLKTIDQGQDIGEVVKYINSASALIIISGILLSVVVAFTIGAIVQYISRLVFTFQFDVKKRAISTAIFGGISIAAITYFIILKGLKGTDYYGEIKSFLKEYTTYIIIFSLTFWTIISYLLNKVFKVNVLKIIILLGTFSLALAFAGNDLVNFIGVPIAAFNSYEAWVTSGMAPDEFMMTVLGKKVPTPVYFLITAGIIMVVTLWTSDKAQKVAKTTLDLSAQGDKDEKFQPNPFSRALVKGSIAINKTFNAVLSQSTIKWIDSRFRVPAIVVKKDVPEFDLIRASVNLLVAAILISIATSMKLPLSTTYVTFMVAMGTSLADRAWGRESAVYRIAGVVNVIAGWFMTAFFAFMIAFVVAVFIYKLGFYVAIVLFFGVLFLLYRSQKKIKEEVAESKDEIFQFDVEKAELDEQSSTELLIAESLKNIHKVIGYINRLFSNTIDGLKTYNVDLLKKNDKDVKKLFKQGNKLRDKLYYIIKSNKNKDIIISNNYIKLLDKIQDMIQSIHYISKMSKEYVDNAHSELDATQKSELENLRNVLVDLMNEIQVALVNRDLNKLRSLYKTTNLDREIEKAINNQVLRIQQDKVSSKNSRLYLSLLLETKDLDESLAKLIRIIFDATKNLEAIPEAQLAESIEKIKEEEKAIRAAQKQQLSEERISDNNEEKKDKIDEGKSFEKGEGKE